MGGAAALVDVHTIGIPVDEIRAGPKTAEELRRGSGCGTVGTVHQYAESGKIALHRGGHKVNVVPLQLAHAVVAAADLPPGAELHRGVGKDLLLDPGLHCIRELVALAAEDLDAVMLIGVVAGGEDDAGVSFLLPGQVRHRRGGDGAHRLHVAAHGADTRHQSGLQHVGGDAGILSDEEHGPPPAVLRQDAGHRLPYPERHLRRQVLANDTPDAVGSKKLAHIVSSLLSRYFPLQY